MSAPLVTVGMPVFNGARYLTQAIESVLAQTSADYEIVISDNASTDGTAGICESFLRRSDRIRYSRQATNIGGHGNFKAVTEAARGRFITWLAHDDVLAPEFIETTVAYLSSHPEAVVASGDFTLIDSEGRVQGFERLEALRENVPWSARRIEFFRHPVSNVFFCIYGLMRTRDCLDTFSALPEPRMASGSELPLLSRLALRGEMAALPRLLRSYRVHDESVYVSEIAGLRRLSFVRRTFAWWVNFNRLRLDQLDVLARSNLSIGEKSRAFASIAWFYLRLATFRLTRLPIYLGRMTKPRRAPPSGSQ